MKKFVSLVLVVVLTLSLITIASAADKFVETEDTYYTGCFKTTQLSTESIIEPGSKFQISKYMFGGFIRSNNISIEINGEIYPVYNSNGYIIFQAAEEMTIYLPNGGYYQQSGLSFNEYNQNLIDSGTLCPLIITGATKNSMLLEIINNLLAW